MIFSNSLNQGQNAPIGAWPLWLKSEMCENINRIFGFLNQYWRKFPKFKLRWSIGSIGIIQNDIWIFSHTPQSLCLVRLLLFPLQIMRDPDTGNSKGYAFINFASFEAADAAIEAMNGQYLCNRPITISYAFRKDAKGERHGSAAGTPISKIYASRTSCLRWLVY